MVNDEALFPNSNAKVLSLSLSIISESDASISLSDTTSGTELSIPILFTLHQHLTKFSSLQKEGHHCCLLHHLHVYHYHLHLKFLLLAIWTTYINMNVLIFLCYFDFVCC